MTRTAVPPLYGPYGRAALDHAGRLADAGVNACWFHMFDAAAFDLCAHHGLAACVEFKTLRADFGQRPELIPVGFDGAPIRYGELVQGVCLSQQAFLDETEAALLDGVRRYRPTGIWLDYLSGAGWFETPEPDLQDSCFCAACITTFCERIGESIDVFTPLIYASKSGRSPEWGRQWLEAAPAFVPAGRRVQPILDALDFPASLEAVAEADAPGWGVQLFGGAAVFADPGKAALFGAAVEKMRSCG